MAVVTLSSARRMAATALANGGRQVGPITFEWEIFGDCQSPYWREYKGVDPGRETWRDVLARKNKNLEACKRLDGLDFVGQPNLRRHYTKTRSVTRYDLMSYGSKVCYVDVWTRCRKCDPCRRVRANLWTHRAKSETGFWGRTWFGTLTMSPDALWRYQAKARMRLKERSVDIDTLPYGAQFLEWHREISVELTKYIKRVRKNSGAPMRYLLVCEQGKLGRIHYHMLVHECDTLRPILHHVLTSAWRLGFTKWKLARDMRSATYLCKYLAKSSVARVRASARYGDVVLRHSENLNVKMTTPNTPLVLLGSEDGTSGDGPDVTSALGANNEQCMAEWGSPAESDGLSRERAGYATGLSRLSPGCSEPLCEGESWSSGDEQSASGEAGEAGGAYGAPDSSPRGDRKSFR